MTTGNAVAITGVGIVSSLGVGAKSLCNGLMNGISGICSNVHGVTPVWAPFAEFDFSTQIKMLNLSEDHQKKIIRTGFRASSPIQAAILAVAEAWSQAQLSRISPQKIGLIVAGSNVNQLDVFDAYQRSFQERQVRPSYGAQFMDSHYIGSISEAFSINGEGYTLGGASASGGVALLHGYRALHCSTMEAMVVVGAPMMLSQVELNGLVNIGAHFNEKVPEVHAFACRPFDVEAAGFVYGQGAGAIIFQREQDSAHRTIARMLGGSMCLDGNQSTNPSVDGEVRVMSAALENAGIIADQIDLVNAHGTASRLGDSTEVSALNEVFHQRSPWVNSTKPLTGHCLSAAGIIEAIACAMQLQHSVVHPNITLDQALTAELKWATKDVHHQQLNYVLSNSFGFGGINTAQVFAHA